MAEDRKPNGKKKVSSKRNPNRPQKIAQIDHIFRKSTSIRRWIMVRNEDISGVSGTGLVAAGVEFATGGVAGSFVSKYPGCFTYPSMSILQHVHSHEGAHDTKIIYVDNLDDEELEKVFELITRVAGDND